MKEDNRLMYLNYLASLKDEIEEKDFEEVWKELRGCCRSKNEP